MRRFAIGAWLVVLLAGPGADVVAAQAKKPSVKGIGGSSSTAPAKPTPPKPATTKPAAKPAAKPATKSAAKPAKPRDPEAVKRDAAALAWNRARALADKRQYDDALVVIQAALIESPGNTDLLWLEAGVLGWAGRNAEAVQKYERLMTDHPQMAPQLRRDLAAQRMWSGDNAGALRDLNVHIAEDSTDVEARRMRATVLTNLNRLPEALAACDSVLADHPGDVETARLRARVLGWMGRHEEAIAAYAKLIDRDPKDVNARIGMAMNENWNGNHARAADQYQAMLDDGVMDPEVMKGLAYAQYGAGRHDEAELSLYRFQAYRPNDPEGAELERLLRGGGGVRVSTGYQHTHDTDELVIGSFTAEAAWQVRRQTSVSAHLRKDDVSDLVGDLDPFSIGVGVDQRWSERWSTQGALDAYWPDPDLDATATGELNGTYRPNPRVRVDGGIARLAVLTRISLANEIFVRVLTLGADWQKSKDVILHGDLRLRHYNDGNDATAIAAWVRWMLSTSPRYDFGLKFSVAHLSTQEDLDNGYYDPDDYLELGPGAVVTWRIPNGWTFDFDGNVGLQRENHGKEEPYHSYNASLGIPLGKAFALNLAAGRSNSNLTSASGYRSKHWSASLSAGF